jgi:membrane AbrB-like protein
MKNLVAAFTWRRLFWAAVTLVLGTLGALLFSAIGVPAAFLSGPMVAVALCAVLRVPVDLPMPLRDVAFVVLGAILGTTMDQETVASLPEWPVSIAGLLIGLVALMTVVPRYLNRVHGIDRRTATLCAIPGALSYVVVLATELDVDARRVAILHTLRLAVLLTLIPATVALAFEMEAAQVIYDGPEMSWPAAILVLLLCALIVPPARLLRFPAPTFVAPMFLTGGLSMSGLLHGAMPLELLWPSLIVSGAVVGARFAGTTLQYLCEGGAGRHRACHRDHGPARLAGCHDHRLALCSGLACLRAGRFRCDAGACLFPGPRPSLCRRPPIDPFPGDQFGDPFRFPAAGQELDDVRSDRPDL